MNSVEKFYNYLSDLLKNYTRLSHLLEDKLVAIEKYDLAKLEDIMKEEQVFVMLANGFDSNLASYRSQLDLTGETLSQVIEELPEEHRARFYSLYQELRAVLETVKGLNEKCQSLIEERLYSLDKSIKELDQSDSATYGKGGNPGDGPKTPPPNLFSKSI